MLIIAIIYLITSYISKGRKRLMFLTSTQTEQSKIKKINLNRLKNNNNMAMFSKLIKKVHRTN